MPNFEETIAALLGKAGWASSRGSALATKTYDTAVGPKTALAWYYAPTTGCGYHRLAGEYWSEGNNILESRALLLSSTIDEATLHKAVARFCRETDQVIGASYAARLLALGWRAPAAPWCTA